MAQKFNSDILIDGKVIITGKSSDDLLLGDGDTTSLSGITAGGGGSSGALIFSPTGNTSGIIKDGRIEGNYLPIGFEATDLSYSTQDTGSGYNYGASGYISMAWGQNNSASGDYSTASGYGTEATGRFSTASGKGTIANADYTTASGFNTTASSYASTASGYGSAASGSASTASGQYATANAWAETSIGSYNTIVAGNAITWIGTDRVFNVGNGTSVGINTSDALTILKKGDVIAPSLTTDIITSGDSKILITKEYGDANYAGGGGGGTEFVDEGNGLGLVKTGRIAANYGPVGFRAVDLSFNNFASTTAGATGQWSFAAGAANQARGAASFAMGQSNLISAAGNSAIALGTSNTVQQTNQVAIGSSNNTGLGAGNITIGSSNTVNSNTVAFAIGLQNIVDGNNAVGIGTGTAPQSKNEIQIGVYPTTYVEDTNGEFVWNTTDRIFTLGYGESSGARADALTVLKSGNVAIGINNFEANDNGDLLQINGDVTVTGNILADTHVSVGYTVATLPTGVTGARTHVTDANATTFYSIVVGGGANIVPVFYNGTNWVIA